MPTAPTEKSSAALSRLVQRWSSVKSRIWPWTVSRNWSIASLAYASSRLEWLNSFTVAMLV
jgi:hypothetical protein